MGRRCPLQPARHVLAVWPCFLSGQISGAVMSRSGSPPSGTHSESPALQKDLRRGSTDPAPSQRRSRLLASASSIVAHGAVVAALLWMHAGPPPARAERAALSVTFVNL